MNEEPVTADSGLDLAAELRQVRALLEQELAAARQQVAAASEAEGAMRAERHQLRHTQVSAEIRVMELQMELTQVVEKSDQRSDERLAKLVSASQEVAAMRLELGRTTDELVMAQAIARNAQTEVVGYEAAQRSQIVRIANLEGRVREFIRERKVMEARLAELAGARSRRLLLKLKLVSRCAWEK